MRPLLPLALIPLLSMQPATAGLIHGVFNSEITHSLGGYNPETDTFDGFGLGIESGDHVAGSFGYESETGEPLYFDARIRDQHFEARNLRMVASSDWHITYFYMMGELANGLFMSVGLTSGQPVLAEIPPRSLISDEWYFGAFKISATTWAPIEAGVGEIEAITAFSYDFLLRATQVAQVPEPKPLVLLGVGLLGAFLLRKSKMLQRRSGA